MKEETPLLATNKLVWPFFYTCSWPTSELGIRLIRSDCTDIKDFNSGDVDMAENHSRIGRHL